MKTKLLKLIRKNYHLKYINSFYVAIKKDLTFEAKSVKFEIFMIDLLCDVGGLFFSSRIRESNHKAYNKRTIKRDYIKLMRDENK